MEHPKEDEAVRAGQMDMVGCLQVSLYGTRDAAKAWQDALSGHIEGIGCVPGKGYPRVCMHDDKKLMIVVHGDDNASAHPKSSLQWSRGQRDSTHKWETHVFNEDSAEGSELNVLSIIVHVASHVYETEPDPRHSEFIVEHLCTPCVNGVATRESRPTAMPTWTWRRRSWRGNRPEVTAHSLRGAMASV